MLKQINEADKNYIPADKAHFTELRDELTKSKEAGNTLSGQLLSVTDTSSNTSLKALYDQLVAAKQKSEPLPTKLVADLDGPFSRTISSRIQEVKPEEYEQVKQLWNKAYKQYFVPPTYTEDISGRTEWIKKDMADITETISLLQSPDEAQKNEGMKKVSSIVPFLLLGGYSYPEMIGYLQAKLEAASTALVSLNEEESKTVSIDATKSSEANNKELAAATEEETKK